jgi:hypothetical protein
LAGGLPAGETASSTVRTAPFRLRRQRRKSPPDQELGLGRSVDLAEATFLASLGMRTLVSRAKTSWANGGKLIPLNPKRMSKKL